MFKLTTKNSIIRCLTLEIIIYKKIKTHEWLEIKTEVHHAMVRVR